MEEEKIIKKLLDHDEQLKFIRDNMVTKHELKGLSEGQDRMITILERLDQERVFTNEWIKRMERSTEEQQIEIKKIKQHLKIA